MGIKVFPEGEMSPSPGLVGTAAYHGFTPGSTATPTGVVACVPGGLGRFGSRAI
ncbi:hypothetical protein BH23VER1_BH23VER1_35140 [soil metagenome]